MCKHRDLVINAKTAKALGIDVPVSRTQLQLRVPVPRAFRAFVLCSRAVTDDRSRPEYEIRPTASMSVAIP